jgi:DeoR family glycerol-3-phosphate regulon repressor
MSTIAALDEADEVISDSGLSDDACRVLRESVSKVRIAEV